MIQSKNIELGFYADFTNQSKEEYCQQLYGMSYDDFIKKSKTAALLWKQS